ncbi:MAG: phenylalanine--tRNA ligase subunit beta, partial [Candidatus Omnitrophica bacterium]|nr:phenylalanine--tRNA ligase subunit beta [Candidatus Omnitrophota bacterium]
MRYSYSLVKECLKEEISPDELLRWLETLGLNPAVNVKTDKEMLFEIEVPANRGDLLSILGLARAIIPFASLTLCLPSAEVDPTLSETFPVDIENTEDCLYYSCRVIRGVRVGPSSREIREKLEKIGFRCSLNVVDLSNLVMAETGQPLHVFDLNRLNKRIIVRRAWKNETLTTLDGRERELDEESLVIADDVKAVALAGIMGGANSEVTEETTDLLLESALFAPRRIRRSSKRTGLITEASLRFEKGIAYETVSLGLNRLTWLILNLAGGQAGPVCQAGIQPKSNREIYLSRKKLRCLLGTNIPPKFPERLFLNLGCQVRVEKEAYRVEVPGYRQDLQEEADLIEEVARYWSYEKIPVSFPETTIVPTPSSPEYLLVERVKDILVRGGWTEVVGSSLVPIEWLRFYEQESLRLVNPLSQSASLLRGSLIPGLLEIVRFNRARGVDSLRLFEVGTIYLGQPVSERLSLGMVIFGEDAYFVLKGYLELFLLESGVEKVAWKKTDQFLASEAGMITCDFEGKPVARQFIPGEEITNFFDLDNQMVSVAEIFLEPLKSNLFRPRPFVPPPLFPASRRDFSLLFPIDVDWSQVEKIIYQLFRPVEKISVFDVYQGEKIPADRISISFSVVFRHQARTLTTEEINQFSSAIIAAMDKHFGGR